MNREDVINLGKRKVAAMPASKYAKAAGFIRSRNGCRELWVQPTKIELLFPEWSALKRRPDGPPMLKRDGKHYKVKRAAGQSGAQARVYCFVLP